MAEEIVKFVSGHEGCSYTDLTSYFEKKLDWSHGKFVNHFKEAKTYLEKRLVNGRPRYFTKKYLKQLQIKPSKQLGSKYYGVKTLLALSSFFAFATYMFVRMFPPDSKHVILAQNSTLNWLEFSVTFYGIPLALGGIAMLLTVLAVLEFKRVYKLARMLLAYLWATR